MAWPYLSMGTTHGYTDRRRAGNGPHRRQISLLVKQNESFESIKDAMV